MLNAGYKTEEISRVQLIDSDIATNWKKTFITRKDIMNWYFAS